MAVNQGLLLRPAAGVKGKGKGKGKQVVGT